METPKQGEIIELIYDKSHSGIVVCYATGERYGNRIAAGSNIDGDHIYGHTSGVLWRYPGETTWRK